MILNSCIYRSIYHDPDVCILAVSLIHLLRREIKTNEIVMKLIVSSQLFSSQLKETRLSVERRWRNEHAFVKPAISTRAGCEGGQ